MDDATKEKMRKEFGPNTIFDDDGIDLAAKKLMPFFYGRMQKLENCTHEPEKHVFPLDPRLTHFRCYCGKVEYIEMSKGCHDEILIDPDLRNFEMHKVKNGKIVEFAGVEVRII